MGFSIAVVTGIICVSLFVSIGILSNEILPKISDLNNSFHEMKKRAVDKAQTDINITNITTVHWWNTNWNYRKKIIIDHDKVAEDLYNFPVLIDITDTDLRDYAQPDGADIVFVDKNNTVQYNHQIEYYDGGTGHLIAWINVTKVSADVDTLFYMYYDYKPIWPAGSTMENPAGVWDSNYKAVYHINETGTGTRWDSTSNDEDLATEGYDGDEATDSGKVDGADDLDGGNDRLVKNCDDFSGSFTVSLWAKAGSTGQSVNSGLYSSYNSATSATFQIDVDGLTPGSYRFRGGLNSLNNLKLLFGTVDTNWHYLTATFDGSVVTIYFDGKYVTSSSWGASGYIGYNIIGSNRGGANFFDGIIDEVQISNKQRNAGWINTSFNNQNSPSTFCSVGERETQSQLHLKITVENTGSTILEIGEFTMLANGSKVSFVHLQPYIYPENCAEFYVSFSTVETKRIKIITENGISDYKTYNNGG